MVHSSLVTGGEDRLILFPLQAALEGSVAMMVC
jgi:hypothetical protein